MLYFAYGELLNARMCGRRCGAARARGIGMLPDFELTLRGSPNLMPSRGRFVMGVVWEVEAALEGTIDREEMVVNRCNRKDRFQVWTPGGGEVEAFVYWSKHELFALSRRERARSFAAMAHSYAANGLDALPLLRALARDRFAA